MFINILVGQNYNCDFSYKCHTLPIIRTGRKPILYTMNARLKIILYLNHVVTLWRIVRCPIFTYRRLGIFKTCTIVIIII